MTTDLLIVDRSHKRMGAAMTTSTPQRLPAPPLRRQPALLRRIFADPQPVLDQLRDELGPIYGLGFGPARMAVIGEPHAMREMFGMGTDPFRWGHKFNVLGFVVGPESMIVSDGAEHRRRRGSVQTAFSRRRLNGWIPTIVERTDVAIDRLAAELGSRTDTVDLYQVGRSLLQEIIVQTMFGERLASRAQEIGDLFRRPQDYLEAPAFKQVPHPLPRTARARVRDDRRALDAIIDAEIAHLRAHPSADPLDVLASLVAGGELSDGEIRDQVVTLVGAGYDTTAATLSWMFWRVALSAGLWSRLRVEADEVFGPSGSGATADEHTLSRLELANRTMRETTRIHPAGVVSPREAAADLTIGGYHIPKGTLILWSAHLAGRDAAAWVDPLRFDPDRFLDRDTDRQALADISWVPFGRGARNCIGFALAQMELTLIIARLAQRLDISPATTELPAPVGMVVNRPKGGAPMRVAVRT